MTADISTLRRKGIILITAGGWAATISLCIMAFWLGENAILAACTSAMINILPTYCIIKNRIDGQARLVIGVMAAIQPVLLLFAMQGSLLQIDMHLYIFVALAALTLLCDIRPIIAASVIIALHHAILAVAAPDWVFWGGAGLVRVMIHALAVVMIGSVLCWIGIGYGKVLRTVEESRRLSAIQTEELIAANQSLEQALRDVEEEREASASERANVLKAREVEHTSIAADFEQSVNAVTHSVAGTAKLLEQSARGLKIIADQAGKEARGVAGSAETASKAASTVARGVSELSSSIANIAVNVSQQSELTARATKKSGGGGEAVGSLTAQSKTIEDATRAIVRIAEKTNLLSLNAAIEAATAGPAGRGFTVVAQEVKVLANQAGHAATEIDSFLTGVRTGTIEAERSFTAIDAVIAELDKAANSIRFDVENQRQSADTIEHYARNAAGEVNDMVGRTKSLASRAAEAEKLSDELDRAATILGENVRNLERSSEDFTRRLSAV